MESLTIGTIAALVGGIAALVAGFATLHRYFKTYITKMLEEQFRELNQRLDRIENDLKSTDMDSCKDYLVRFLADIERGIIPDQIEKQRFLERYDHYRANGGNSYIKDKVETLRSRDLI